MFFYQLGNYNDKMLPEIWGCFDSLPFYGKHCWWFIFGLTTLRDVMSYYHVYSRHLWGAVGISKTSMSSFHCFSRIPIQNTRQEATSSFFFASCSPGSSPSRSLDQEVQVDTVVDWGVTPKKWKKNCYLNGTPPISHNPAVFSLLGNLGWVVWYFYLLYPFVINNLGCTEIH